MSALAPLGRALARGASPRLLLVFVATLFLPAVLAMLPIHAFLREHFGHFPGASDAVSSLGSFALTQLLTQAGEPTTARALGQGILGAALVALFVAPFLAGVAGAEARAEASLGLRELLLGGAEHYGRMVKMTFVAALPYALAGVVAVVASKVAARTVDSAVLESSAVRAERVRDLVVVLAFWLAHVTLEAGRAHLFAEPARRSAFLAWWAGVRLLATRPLRVLGLTAATGMSSVLVAGILVAIRMRLGQGGVGGITAAFVLGQLTVAAMGWGRASGLIGLVDVVRGPSPRP